MSGKNTFKTIPVWTQCCLLLCILLTSLPSEAAQTDTSWFSFIQDTFNRHDKHQSEFLDREITAFNTTYPNSTLSADALLLKAHLTEGFNEEYTAFVFYLKVLMVYPDFHQTEVAKDRLYSLLASEKHLRKNNNTVREAVEDIAANGPPADRIYAFVDLLSQILVKDLCESALVEYYGYLTRYPDDPRCLQILRWQADAFALYGQEIEAVAVLEKVETLFPASEFLPAVMYRRALLLANELGQEDQALELLDKLYSSYPNHPIAASALFERAHIKSEEKDKEGSAADYRLFADNHGDDPRVLDVLFVLADITLNDLEVYHRTDNIYDEIVTQFPQDNRAAIALEYSAKLNLKKLKNYERAALQYGRVAELYPDHEDAPDDLFEAVDIAENKVEDLDLAIKFCDRITTTWPNSEHSRDAEKKRAELMKEKSEER